MTKKVIVIGAGFAGLATATALADAGFDVTIIEKNEMAGGRARKFEADGFVFDMGPSWYWMPDIFEEYFARFGKKTSDYYELLRLDPSYQVIFSETEAVKLPAGVEALSALFESIEEGASVKLKQFLGEAQYKYKVGIGEFVWKPSLSIREFFDVKIIRAAFRLDLFKSFSKHVRRFFQNKRLLQIVEFPVLFLGATPQSTPALYSMMNYAEMAMGTWYPKGGMHEIVRGMLALAQEKGVKVHLSESVERIEKKGRIAQSVITNKQSYEADFVVAGADYHHVENDILGDDLRNYDESYWNKRVMAPSSLLFYLGVNRKVEKLEHHNLFFDEDFDQHAKEIYETPQYPSKPLFYVSAPSKTDPLVAPATCENLFVLIPLAPDLEDTDEQREKYYQIVMERLERFVGHDIRSHVVFKRSYAHRDFKADYHAFRGNAYGLANTLMQTAILKPSLRNKHIDNFFYTGQLTVPGPGVPPSLISGLVVAKHIIEKNKNQ